EDWFRKGLDESSTTPNIQEVGSYHAMIACAAAGTSISVIPRSVLELLREPVEIEQVLLTEIDTWMVWREGYETPAFNELYGLLTDISASEPILGK
ncbi:MAG: LysR substrate-binding domain-containing protein, partial [Marinobacter sp.]